MIGLVVLLLGLQFRMVSSYVLNEEATKFLAERAGKTTQTDTAFPFDTLADTPTAAPRKVIQPPDWSGWCLMSVGSVMILQSLVMKKPD